MYEVAAAIVVAVGIATYGLYRKERLKFDHQIWLFSKQMEATEALNSLTSSLVQEHDHAKPVEDGNGRPGQYL